MVSEPIGRAQKGKIRVAALQCPIGREFQDNLGGALEVFKRCEKQVDFVCFPEYFAYPSVPPAKDLRVFEEPLIQFYCDFSRIYRVTTIGNVIIHREDAVQNVAMIFSCGELVGTQAKLYPTKSELKRGVKPGQSLEVFEIQSVRIGVLLCADILFPEATRLLGLKDVDVIFVPVTSSLKMDEETRNSRVSMFISRAYDSDSYIVKAGGYGPKAKGGFFVGRSLIVSPWGIVRRGKSETESEVLVAALDLVKLRERKNRNEERKALNKDLIHGLEMETRKWSSG